MCVIHLLIRVNKKNGTFNYQKNVFYCMVAYISPLVHARFVGIQQIYMLTRDFSMSICNITYWYATYYILIRIKYDCLACWHKYVKYYQQNDIACWHHWSWVYGAEVCYHISELQMYIYDHVFWFLFLLKFNIYF